MHIHRYLTGRPCGIPLRVWGGDHWIGSGTCSRRLSPQAIRIDEIQRDIVAGIDSAEAMPPFYGDNMSPLRIPYQLLNAIYDGVYRYIPKRSRIIQTGPASLAPGCTSGNIYAIQNNRVGVVDGYIEELLFRKWVKRHISKGIMRLYGGITI